MKYFKVNDQCPNCWTGKLIEVSLAYPKILGCDKCNKMYSAE